MTVDGRARPDERDAPDEPDEEPLRNRVAELDSRAVVRNGRFVGVRSPLRVPGLAALALTAVLLGAMLTVGGIQVGRFPLAERLFAYDVAACGVTLVLGLLALPARRTRPAARALLTVAFATFAAGLLALGCADLLPLHLGGLRG